MDERSVASAQQVEFAVAEVALSNVFLKSESLLPLEDERNAVARALAAPAALLEEERVSRVDKP